MFSSKRASALPDVPSMMEATGHDLPADIVNGFMVPAGTPKAIIEFLHRETGKVMSMPDTRDKLGTMASILWPARPRNSHSGSDRDRALGARSIREANIALQ
jgi:tripartite-type tricarboxylate transporter receptor subunit TctC